MTTVGFVIIGNSPNSLGLPVSAPLCKEMKRIFYLSTWNSKDTNLFTWEAKMKMGLTNSK